MINANGSNLGNTCGQIPGNLSSFVPNLSQQRDSNLCHQYIRNQVGFATDWRMHPRVSHRRHLIRNKIYEIFRSNNHYERDQQAFDIANILENGLFIDAASQDEYMNPETLVQRLHNQLNKLYAANCSPQVDSFYSYTSNTVPSSGFMDAWSNGSLVEPAFHKVAGPIINASDYGAMTVDNKYGILKGGLSHPSIVYEPVFSPDDCSSITTCNDMDVLSNFSVSGGGSNLEDSSKSINSYFPQQQADNLEMNPIEYRDCSWMQKNDSMHFLTTTGKSLQSESSDLLTPRHVSREISEASNIFPGLSSLGDIRQNQYQKLDVQQNPKHIMQPYYLQGKTYMAQPNSGFVNQGEHCCQMLGQNTLEQPQLFTRLHNGHEQFTSESPAVLVDLDGSANMNSCSRSKVSVERRILVAYFRCKNLNSVVSRDKVMKYLHSKVCCEGLCSCQRYIKLLCHFDNCQSVKCRICGHFRKLVDTDILKHPLQFPNGTIMGSFVRKKDAPSGNSEAMLPPAKRLKLESASGVSLINSASSDQLTHKMIQTYSSEALSDLQQQPESPLSSTYSEVTEGNVKQFTNPMLDSISVSEIKNNVTGDTFGQTFKSRTILSIGTEADHMSVEPELKSCNVKASSNMKETVIRSNFHMDTLCEEPIPADIEDIQGRHMFDQAGVNATKKVIKPTADQEKETKSSDPTVNMSEELELKSCNVKASRNLKESVIRSNFHMDTLCEEPIPADIEDIQDRHMFDQAGVNATNKVIKPTADQEKETKSSDPTVNMSEELELKSCNVKASSNLKETVIRSNFNMHTLCGEPMPVDIEDIQGRHKLNQASVNAKKKVIKSTADQEKETLSSYPTVNTVIRPKTDQEKEMMPSNPTVNTVIRPKTTDQEKEMMSSNPTVNTVIKPKTDQEKETMFPNPTDNTVIEPKADEEKETMSSNPTINTVIEPKADQEKETMSANPTVATVIEPKADQEKETMSANPTANAVIETKDDQEKEIKTSYPTVNTVSLTDFFTRNEIKEHIKSLRQQFVGSSTNEESDISEGTCQLCEMGTLCFSPVPIYCLCCGIHIKQNANYYYRKAEDTQHCFCTVCYRNSRSGCITFNGISVSKKLLDKERNNRQFSEDWVECSKCRRWQHQICALYNVKRDSDARAVYTCPICRLKEIENGIHVSLPKTAMFSAKDLPTTMLSDHIERRLFKRLRQESEDWANVEGNKNLDEVLVVENLSVRVVLSVDKQLEVKKQFRDIFVEENYPTEFCYTSKVILLFQQIEGVDVCLFGMYVQEFGSECGYPNQRCVYISYLDSVKYFRPERKTMSGEALRTFVYHEILIGYLDFCKKRGFTTCYIWACPPLKGEDYILYCHPDTQKTPKNDKLRHWYHSMLRKAAEENIVVSLTNIYDHFFVHTGNCDSKVTAAHLPYFDGDYWSGAAMDIARKIEQESGGEYERILKKQVPKRTLKAMGHENPSKGTAKDILVMQKMGQIILPVKEDFIIVQFQYACMHCHEVIMSGKRWFCTECKKFQECERCHTTDSHTSINGEKHKLNQVLMDDILFDTKENEVILDNNGLFEDRHKFLSFCQTNRFQFDTLRRAKYSSMMILYQQELKQKLVLIQELQDVILHGSQCHKTRTEPCNYPYCLEIKKLFCHASRCTTRVLGGCQHCKKAWLGLTVHSRNCRDSGCHVPRCKDLKKYAEWIATQAESRRRAAVLESNRALADH